ncbi:hypothetical protein B4Q23_2159 [Lacticaseibacillus paracasei]|nr:hypothetical protein Lpp226_1764 [Lacticaseibacillus paracasei subsp. paracasei Lpp226]EPC23091.1 hypothetical protein Lpp17_2501 [Lacticaseibacillus paracasei subsp. paracasei Lpp17]OUC71204.1 hypothetical protein B4Q23_2159 [Lacticaseibacillus paracasei]
MTKVRPSRASLLMFRFLTAPVHALFGIKSILLDMFHN